MMDVAELAGYAPQTYAEPPHKGILVALWIDRSSAERITLTEPPEDLHITLRYDRTGDIDFAEHIERIREVVASHEPISGYTTGMGRFFATPSSDGKDVIYAVPDVQGLSSLREDIIEALGGDPSEHGWTPHITVAYVPPEAPTPFNEPNQFMAPGQPRDNDGKWTKGGMRGEELAHDGDRTWDSIDGPVGLTGAEWQNHTELLDEVSLSPSAALGVDNYRFGFYEGVNAGLRSGKVTAEFASTVKGMDEAIDAHPPVDRITTVYRGVTQPLGKPGDIFSDPAFVSTSSIKSVAAGFGDVAGGKVYAVKLPPGQKALYMPNVYRSSGADQGELVLPRNTRFKIGADGNTLIVQSERSFSEPNQFMAPGQARDKNGRWTKSGFGGPADLDPHGGVRMDGQGYHGGVPPFTGGGLSNETLSPENEHLRKTPVDTDLIVALREYNAHIPETISIQDSDEVFYGGKVMSRGEMRTTIATEFIDGKHDENFQGYAKEKTLDIYMGPPAAGKSGAVAKNSGKNYMEVDSDRVKTLIPEFNGGKNANGVHQESSYINDAILHESMARGYKIALPVVGKSPGSINQTIDAAIKQGYKVNVHMVQAPASSILPRMQNRVTNTGRFVDPKYYHEEVQNKPLDVFRSIRNDPRINSVSAWDTTSFPAKERNPYTFADMEPGRTGPLDLGGRVAGGTDDARGGEASSGLQDRFSPLTYEEKPNRLPFRPVPISFSKVTIKQGDLLAEIPLLGDDDIVYDVSEVMEFSESDWTAERLRRFADWLGYNIEPNPDSSLGYSVTSPSGRRLGGFVASRIIAGWQKNPTLQLGAGGKGKKKSGGKGGTGKTPEQKAAEKAQKEAEKLAKATQKAAESISDIDPELLMRKSKGKIDAKSIQSFIDAAQKDIANATDSKAVTEALRQMKRNIAAYKREATKPPPLDQQLADTKAKLKEALPSATRLAGTTYDESEIDRIIQDHIKLVNQAGSADEAKKAIKDMRSSIADYKLAEQKAKKVAAAAKKAAPKTASEWAAFYMDAFEGPEQFMAPGQPRANDGKWTKGGAGTKGFKNDAEGKAFLDSHYASWRGGLTAAEDKGMTFYQSPGYELMNGQLRGTSLKAKPDDLKRATAATKGLDSAIKKAPPLTEPTQVYRGFSSDQFGKLAAGMSIQDKGFVSTSLTEGQAGSFTSRGGQAIARINLPAGTKAAGGRQKELVLPRNAKFQVTSVKKVGKTTYVEMDYLP